jgi:hypothetical protein
LLGYFGRPTSNGKAAKPTCVLVVNLDYHCSSIVSLRGPSRLETFDAINARWSRAKGKITEPDLPPGGGKLLRVRD